MTREELLLDRCKVLLKIKHGKSVIATFVSDDLPEGKLRYTCDNFTVDIPQSDILRPGWGHKAMLRLVETVLDDLERELKKYEIEDAETHGRELRKVSVRKRTNSAGGRDKDRARQRTSRDQS